VTLNCPIVGGLDLLFNVKVLIFEHAWSFVRGDCPGLAILTSKGDSAIPPALLSAAFKSVANSHSVLGSEIHRGGTHFSMECT
jgi:hypothetical protein